MDITILLIAIIFLLLVVLITGTAIFCAVTYKAAKRALARTDLLGDEQMAMHKTIGKLHDRIDSMAIPEPKPTHDPMSREEQFARMMAMRPPAGLKLDDIGGDGQ